MAVQIEVHEKVAKRKTAVRGRRPVAAAAVAVNTMDDIEERTEPREEVVAAPSPRSMPRIVSVYRSAVTGEVHHARCATELSFIGIRGGIEVDFYCMNCREHITLPGAALMRVPVGQGS
jgi:hypothetical protein